MDPLRLTEFDWDESNEASATKHGFTIEQIESGFTSRMWVRRSRAGTYVGLAHLEGGQYVEIAFELVASDARESFIATRWRRGRSSSTRSDGDAEELEGMQVAG